MADNYLGFTYNNKKLGIIDDPDFKGFIVNSSNDLRFFNTPNFSNSFVNANFGERTYFSGVTKTNRTLNFNIQLDAVTLQEYREFLDWLSPDSSGDLVFDYNPNYAYEVKLESLSEGEMIVKKTNSEDEYYVNISVSFITLYDYAAKWIGSTGEKFTVSSSVDDYTFVNNHKLRGYFTITFTTDLTIKTDEETPVTLVDITGSGTYYSEYGIAVNAGGNFLSCGPDPAIAVEAGETKTLTITSTDSFSIELVARENL